MGDFLSSHNVAVQLPATYVEVAPTILANKLAVAKSLPVNAKESLYKE